MQRTKWTDRKFSFDFPEGWMLNILERLKGTGARINGLIINLSDEELSSKPNGKWSIKEQVGHLSDLEELHDGRINDFIMRNEILRAADMSNAKTYEAKHNERSITELLEEFKNKRNLFASRLEKLDDETQSFKALHPRLQLKMRPVDMAFFTAEHDDHHLASIREILKQIK
jgi:hypothetical protein